MTKAVLASKARTPRKSRCSAPWGMAQACQILPPSVVLRTVPLLPEAQATRWPIEWMPRRSAVVLLVWSCHWAEAMAVTITRSTRRQTARRMQFSVAKNSGDSRIAKRCDCGSPRGMGSCAILSDESYIPGKSQDGIRHCRTFYRHERHRLCGCVSGRLHPPQEG